VRAEDEIRRAVFSPYSHNSFALPRGAAPPTPISLFFQASIMATENLNQGAGGVSVSLSGDDLADFLLRPVSSLSSSFCGASSAGGADGSASASVGVSVGAVMRQAREVETRHEVVALVPSSAGPPPGGFSSGGSLASVPPSSRYQLLLNYHNWTRFRRDVDQDEPTMVISFLGDTEVGKSHTIRELMDAGEDRPFVQRGQDQHTSTTANVNLYPCKSLVPGVTVNMLDYEGEHGSEATVFGGASKKVNGALLPSSFGGGGAAGGAAAAASAGSSSSGVAGVMKAIGATFGGGAGAGPGSGPSSAAAAAAAAASPALGMMRADAVKEFFPRLAYTTSDVVVVVGTEPFFSTRYLERVIEFAKRANAGVTDVDLPVLLLVSNKRDGDRCVLDLQASTEQFVQACGDSFRLLDQFFSALVCVYLPNKRNKTVDELGNVHDGAEMFGMQIGKLKVRRLRMRRGVGVVDATNAATDHSLPIRTPPHTHTQTHSPLTAAPPQRPDALPPRDPLRGARRQRRRRRVRLLLLEPGAPRHLQAGALVRAGAPHDPRAQRRAARVRDPPRRRGLVRGNGAHRGAAGGGERHPQGLCELHEAPARALPRRDPRTRPRRHTRPLRPLLQPGE
jgi:hypothetical protein